MNKPLRRLAAAVMVMFALLLLNANFLQVVRADKLHNDSRNPRLILEEYSRQRGPILVGGDPVAKSVETKDRLKYKRVYSDGKLYAPVTGYYSLVYGASGIEAAENSILSGTDDKLFVRRVVDLLTREPPRGGSVSLTLNAKAQQVAYKDLAGRKGAVVAVDPTTGAILAMVSSPSYDPNLLSSHDGSVVRANYAKLNGNKLKPMLNRALRETYAPGSTFKLVTSAAALESGQRPDSKVYNGASLDLPQTTANLPNENGRPCVPGSTATLKDALAYSCNASFGKVGLDLGADALAQQAKKFGFDAAFTVPMRSAVSSFPGGLNAPQTAQSAIGQFSVRATPLQMAMVGAAIANNGVLMRPYLVQDVRAPDLSVIDTATTKPLGEAMTPGNAALLTDMMVNVVENGTGTNGQISGIKVAGKTGTAQDGNRRPHAWFVSFAPAQQPKVAVAVVIENGGGATEISGNQLAAPIARDVMRAVLGR